jgi:hypothetical protein
MIRVGALLPALSLDSVPAGTTVGLRSGRGPAVFVLTHSSGCQQCAQYLQQLARAADLVLGWGGRLFAVVPGAAQDATALLGSRPHPLRVLADREGKLANGNAQVIISDEWGEVYFATDSRSTHELPTPGTIEEWVRFIAIQCPECEGPEGEWVTMKKVGDAE